LEDIDLVASGLIGKAGEALVAAELLRRNINVAYPAYDDGVDLLAYREQYFGQVVPIQVKAASSAIYTLKKEWLRIHGSILVQVWFVATNPEFYIFDSINQMEDALDETYSASPSWMRDNHYHIPRPQKVHADRWRRHRDKWERIISRVGV